jgi:nitrite reductase/ring-hydroxylating ferredoxin subunit
MIHTIPRSALRVTGVVAFEVAGLHCLVADVDGDIQAFSVVGQAAGRIDRALVVEGRMVCPLHGWPIDAAGGGCGAGTLCSFERLPVEADAGEIRVSLPGP